MRHYRIPRQGWVPIPESCEDLSHPTSSTSTNQAGEIIVCDLTKHGNWSSVRISRAILFRTSPKTGQYSGKRNQNSTSNHRNTSEKYYDCFQCAEQCRHLSLKNNYNYNNTYNSNSNSYNSNKNSYKSNKNCYNNSNKNSYNNSNKKSINNFNKNSNKNNNVSKSAKITRNDPKKISDILNGGKSYFQPKKNEMSLIKERVLKSVSNRQVLNYQISKHQFPKNQMSNYQISNNQMLNNQISDYQISNQPTPAKKRSSLARPVRVYDYSFATPKWIMNNERDYPLKEFEDLEQFENRRQFHEQNQFHNHQQFDHRGHFDSQEQFEGREEFEDQEKFEDLDQHQHLEPNSSRAYFDARDDDTNWPIRLRLEELLATQNKKKKRKSIVTIRKSKIIKADTGKNSFKDTERLLKALSNHVDQDSRYNVKRCCVM